MLPELTELFLLSESTLPFFFLLFMAFLAFSCFFFVYLLLSLSSSLPAETNEHQQQGKELSRHRRSKWERRKS